MSANWADETVKVIHIFIIIKIDTYEMLGFFKRRKFRIQGRYNFYLSNVKISRFSRLLHSQPIGNYHHNIAFFSINHLHVT